MSTTGYAKLQNDFWRSPKGMKLKKRNPSAGFLYILCKARFLCTENPVSQRL